MIIPLWVKALIILAIVGALVAAEKAWEKRIYQRGYDAAVVDQKIATDKAITQREQENKLILAKQELTHKQEIKDYEAKLSKSNSAIANARAAIVNAGGLRLPAAVCRSFAGTNEAKDAGKGNGNSPATIELPSRIETGLLAIAERADKEVGELTAKVEMCQQFARDNGFDK